MPQSPSPGATRHGVFDIIEGRTPPTGGPHLASRLGTVLAVLTLTALTIGAFGVVPAVAFPRLAEAWLGRTRDTRPDNDPPANPATDLHTDQPTEGDATRGCDPGHLTGVTDLVPDHARQQCLTRP